MPQGGKIPKPVDFLKAFRFTVIVDGRNVGIARVSDVDRTFGPNGRKYTKPITIEAAPKAGTLGLAGALGERPWERKDVRLIDRANDDTAARTIHLDGCKVRGVVTNAHDAMADEVVMDRVKLHPTKVRYAAGGSLPEPEEG